MKHSPLATGAGIAVVGYGTVGTAVVRLLQERKAQFGVELELRYVVSHTPDSIRPAQLAKGCQITLQYERALADPDVSIIVELIGGTKTARALCLQALRAGKHVVTANKALLAEHGGELFACAREHGVVIGFEASCCAGIPIISALYSGLVANRIEAMYGIVNGTCNYILSEMSERGCSYPDTLRQAQDLGFAESDPRLDVGGDDSAHKIALLATLAFGVSIDWRSVSISGIDSLQQMDIHFGCRLDYIIKLLAIATREDASQEGGVSVRVRPCFIEHSHPLAWVEGTFNAVSIYGHAVGHTLLYGRGAGGDPTASAVVADIVGIARGEIEHAFRHFPFWPDRTPKRGLVPVGETVSRFYIRCMVADRPGVLAQIAAILGHHTINIASVHQYDYPHHPDADSSDRAAPSSVPLIITLHPCRERNVCAAVQEIDRLAAVETACTLIPIVDVHDEYEGRQPVASVKSLR